MRGGRIALRFLALAALASLLPAAAAQNSSALHPETCSVITAAASCDSYADIYGCRWCGEQWGCLLASPPDQSGALQEGRFECPRPCQPGDSPCYTVGGTVGSPVLFNATVANNATCFLQQVRCTALPCSRAYYCGDKCRAALVDAYDMCTVGWADGSNPSTPPEANEIGIYVDPTVPQNTGLNVTVALAVSIPLAVVFLTVLIGCIVLKMRKHNAKERALDEAGAIEKTVTRARSKNMGQAMSKVSMMTMAETKAADSAAVAAALAAADAPPSPSAYEKKDRQGTMASDTPSVSSSNSAGTLVLTAAEEVERRAETGEWEVQRMLDGRPISVVPKPRHSNVPRSPASPVPKAPGSVDNAARTGSDAASNRSNRSRVSSTDGTESLGAGGGASPAFPSLERGLSKEAQRALVQQEAERQLQQYMPAAVGLPSPTSPLPPSPDSSEPPAPLATPPSTPPRAFSAVLSSPHAIRAPHVLPLAPTSPAARAVAPITPAGTPRPLLGDAELAALIGARPQATPAQQHLASTLRQSAPPTPLSAQQRALAATFPSASAADAIAQLRLDAAIAADSVARGSGTPGAATGARNPERSRMYKDIFDEI
ncbi:hypothetical protein DFJ74DRAFT_486933 [Hyaloraphidium curvatum]|nr:hypothetical protein DFJ74DRAFT_486933 [Hyaloraphidium curvatum]